MNASQMLSFHAWNCDRFGPPDLYEERIQMTI